MHLQMLENTKALVINVKCINLMVPQCFRMTLPGFVESRIWEPMGT